MPYTDYVKLTSDATTSKDEDDETEKVKTKFYLTGSYDATYCKVTSLEQDVPLKDDDTPDP